MTRAAAEKKHIAKEQADSVLKMDLCNKRKTPPQKQLLGGGAAECVGKGCDVGGEDVRNFLKR